MRPRPLPEARRKNASGNGLQEWGYTTLRSTTRPCQVLHPHRNIRTTDSAENYATVRMKNVRVVYGSAFKSGDCPNNTGTRWTEVSVH